VEHFLNIWKDIKKRVKEKVSLMEEPLYRRLKKTAGENYG
jgi:hypothetical protein